MRAASYQTVPGNTISQKRSSPEPMEFQHILRFYVWQKQKETMLLDASTRLAFEMLDAMLQNHEVEEAFGQQLMDDRDKVVAKLIQQAQSFKLKD